MSEVYRARDLKLGRERWPSKSSRRSSHRTRTSSSASKKKRSSSPRSIIRTSPMIHGLERCRRRRLSRARARPRTKRSPSASRKAPLSPQRGQFHLFVQVALRARGGARKRDHPPRPQARQRQDHARTGMSSSWTSASARRFASRPSVSKKTQTFAGAPEQYRPHHGHTCPI